MIELRNVEIKDYIINANIDEFSNIGIFCDDINIIKELSLYISGINKSNIYYLDNNIYDNNEYFKSRIFINNNINYLNTLNADKISSYFLNNYQKALDNNYFKELVKASKIRLNAKYKYYYEFDDNKKSEANNILALSFLQRRIVFQAFKNLDNEYIKNEYKKKKETIFLDDIKDINEYLDILDYILILYKGRIFYQDLNNDFFKVLKNEESNNVEIIKNLMYEDDKYYYVYNAENVKSIKKLKYETINIKKIGEKHE